MKNQNQRYVHLINCEGAILKAKCLDEEKLLFQIVDQWGMGVRIFSSQELIEFMSGFSSITDSEGNIWNVSEVSSTMVVKVDLVIEKFKEQGIKLISADKPKKNILYLNGFQSKLIEPKRDILQRWGNLYAPYVDHHIEHGIYNKFSKLIADNKIDVIIGSSMGGALGFLLSSNFNIPALLFNPAIPYYEGVLNPNQSVTSYQKCVLGYLDTVIDPIDTLSELRKCKLPNLSIKIVNDLEHKIPVEVFDSEINIFMNELFLKTNKNIDK